MMRSILFATLMSFAASVAAEGFSYNHVTAGYSRTEIDDIDVDGNGLGISLSYALTDRFHVVGAYGTGDLDADFGPSVDFDTASLGFGSHLSLSDRLDLVGTITYEWAELSIPGFGSEDDNGYGLGAGLRFAPNAQWELDGGLTYVNFGDAGDDVGLNAGALYNFTDMFSLGLSGAWTDDGSSYGIGGRFYFGK